MNENIRYERQNHAARTASEQVAEQIRSLIASGEVKPGDMLPSERLLIDAYDVARPTMRGALRILESDGLISIERGTHGGARVLEPDLVPLARLFGLHLQMRGANMRELFDTQAALLPTAVSLAAGNRTDPEIQQLRSIVERCGSAATLETFLLAVADFGTAVLKATHNRVLALYGELSTAVRSEALYDFASSAGFTFENLEIFLRRTSKFFSSLVDLIEAGEADRAERLWKNELTRASAALWPEQAPLELYRSSDPKRRKSCRASTKSQKRARNLRTG
jgi:GntR family transcriptional regulator, transcriptional repressor for pyruvate dehydrogenase complex